MKTCVLCGSKVGWLSQKLFSGEKICDKCFAENKKIHGFFWCAKYRWDQEQKQLVPVIADILNTIRPSTIEPSSSLVDTLFFDDNQVSIGDEHFHIEHRSKNGKFAAAISSAHYEYSKWKNGSIALFDVEKKSLLFKIVMIRPEKVYATNEGNVIVENWKKPDELGTSFFYFDVSGQMIWKKIFSCATQNFIVCNDEKWFSFTALDKESDKTFLIELNTGQELWSDVNDLIELSIKDDWPIINLDDSSGEIREFRFSDNGKPPEDIYRLIDEIEENEDDQFEMTCYQLVLPQIKAALAKSPPDIEQARSLLSNLDPKSKQCYKIDRAMYWRYWGEIAEMEGNTEKAISLFEKAVSIEPKVGLKRKLQQLKENQ